MTCRWLLMGSLIWLGACASKTPAPAENRPIESAESQMQKGIKALDAEDYGEAVAVFDHLLTQKPGSEFDLLALYNAGVAHVGMGECKRASELYRQAVQGARVLKLDRVEAESLYQLSLAYECLGDDRKTITALFDTRRHTRFLPPEIASAELPARMAAAYARIGQRKKALEYFREAGNGLKSALVESGGTTAKVRQKFAAQVLYSMGQLTARQKALESDPEAYLKSLSVQQPYLLQSAELGVHPSSRKAADDLIYAYENLMKLTPSNSVQARSYLTLALQDIAELKNIRLPGKGSLVDEIYAKVEVLESRVREKLTAQSDITPLTDAARRREGLRREGRSEPGPSTLERGKRPAQ